MSLSGAVSLYAFRRGAASKWAEEVSTDFAKQLLGHGRQKDVTALHYTRDVLTSMDITAVALGETQPALAQAAYTSTAVALTAPAVTVLALRKSAGQSIQTAQSSATTSAASPASPEILVDAAVLNAKCDNAAVCAKAFAIWKDCAEDFARRGLVALYGEGHNRYLGVELGKQTEQACAAAGQIVLFGNAKQARTPYLTRRNQLKNQLRKELIAAKMASLQTAAEALSYEDCLGAQSALAAQDQEGTSPLDALVDLTSDVWRESHLSLWTAADDAASLVGLSAAEAARMRAERGADLATLDDEGEDTEDPELPDEVNDDDEIPPSSEADQSMAESLGLQPTADVSSVQAQLAALTTVIWGKLRVAAVRDDLPRSRAAASASRSCSTSLFGLVHMDAAEQFVALTEECTAFFHRQLRVRHEAVRAMLKTNPKCRKREGMPSSSMSFENSVSVHGQHGLPSSGQRPGHAHETQARELWGKLPSRPRSDKSLPDCAYPYLRFLQLAHNQGAGFPSEFRPYLADALSARLPALWICTQQPVPSVIWLSPFLLPLTDDSLEPPGSPPQAITSSRGKPPPKDVR